MTTIDMIRTKIISLKNEAKNNINLSPDERGKAVLETTYDVLAGLEEALGSYVKG